MSDNEIIMDGVSRFELNEFAQKLGRIPKFTYAGKEGTLMFHEKLPAKQPPELSSGTPSQRRLVSDAEEEDAGNDASRSVTESVVDSADSEREERRNKKRKSKHSLSHETYDASGAVLHEAGHRENEMRNPFTASVSEIPNPFKSSDSVQRRLSFGLGQLFEPEKPPANSNEQTFNKPTRRFPVKSEDEKAYGTKQQNNEEIERERERRRQSIAAEKRRLSHDKRMRQRKEKRKSLSPQKPQMPLKTEPSQFENDGNLYIYKSFCFFI